MTKSSEQTSLQYLRCCLTAAQDEAWSHLEQPDEFDDPGELATNPASEET